MSTPKKARRRLARVNRMRLRRGDGSVYLERWGVEMHRIGGIFIHRITAPDPGVDLHTHPWAFASFLLKGSYEEERAPGWLAPRLAVVAERKERGSRYWPRGVASERRRWTWRRMGVDECHRITKVNGACWTLVVRGPYRQPWGFYVPTGWLDEHTYADTDRGTARGLWDEFPSNPPLGASI